MNEDSGSIEKVIHEHIGVETTFCISQRVLIITEDKLQLLVNDGLAKFKASGEWATPFGIFLASLIAIVSADFKNLWLSSSSWRALFVVSTLTSFVWLVLSLVKRRTFTTLELIATIKNASTTRNSSVPIATSEREKSESFQESIVDSLPSSQLQCVRCGHLVKHSDDGSGVCKFCGTIN